MYGSFMFINARNALTSAGATARRMPFEVTVQAQHREDGPWKTEFWGYSVDFLADCFNDCRVLWPHARLINSETGTVIFSG